MNPSIRLNLNGLFHCKSITPVQWMLYDLRGMPFRKRHQQRMMVRSNDAEIPLEVCVRVRLHASKLDLRLSNHNIVNSRSMCAI